MSAPLPVVTLLGEYQAVLARLHVLATQGADANDPVERHELRQRQVRLVDDLGPTLAETVARLCARDLEGPPERCPMCGGAWDAGDRHERWKETGRKGGKTMPKTTKDVATRKLERELTTMVNRAVFGRTGKAPRKKRAPRPVVPASATSREKEPEDDLWDNPF
jgi:hypothetical protein